MDFTTLTAWLATLLGHLPALVAITAAMLWVLIQRERLGPAFPWALAGFGLLLVVSLIVPSTQVLVQRWAISHYATPKQVGVFFLILSLFWSCAYAASFVLLTLAIFAGRRRAGVSMPPPLPIVGPDVPPPR